jgi:hypothetical protein
MNPTGADNSRWLRIVCWAGIALGCVWRAVHVWRYNPVAALWSDSGRNWEFGSLATRTHPLVLVDPIGFQTWLAAIQKLTLGIPALVFIVVATLSLAGPWLWYRFFRELFASKTVALAGWAILALLPSWIGIYSYFMMETLFIPLLGLALWMTWRCRRRDDVASFVVMGVCWLAAGLTRSIAAPMAAAIVLWLWWCQPEKLVKALSVGGIVAAVLGFLAFRSYERSGIIAPLGVPYLARAYALSGKQEILIEYTSSWGEGYGYGFGSPVSNEQPLSPFLDWKNDRVGSFRVQIDLAQQRAGWEAAVQQARAEGWPLTKIAKENLIYLMFGRSWPDCADNRLAEIWTQHVRWLWAPLTLVGAVGLLAMRSRRSRDATPLLLLFAAWFVVQGLLPISVNEGRYRKPMEGLFIAAILLMADQRFATRRVAQAER